MWEIIINQTNTVTIMRNKMWEIVTIVRYKDANVRLSCSCEIQNKIFRKKTLWEIKFKM